MDKLELMKNFASRFVGQDFYLIIRDYDTSVLVHTIEIIQKTDDTCQLKHIPIGDYFFRILAVDPDNNQAYILCDWSEQLVQNLLTQHKRAKKAGFNKIVMTRESTSDPNSWILIWGEEAISSVTKTTDSKSLDYIY
jgi:hypothetical protein